MRYDYMKRCDVGTYYNKILFVIVQQLILVLISEIYSAAAPSLRMPSIFEKYVELYCYKTTIWFLIPLSYNLFIMLLCAWIGFFTRKLPNNFNESWFIFVSVATTLFAWVVFIPAYFTVANVSLQSAILGFAMILNSLVTLLFQYVPVLYAIAFVPAEKLNTVTITASASSVSAIGPHIEG